MNIAVHIESPPATYQDVLDAPENMVCEVISPSTARIDRVEKRQIYAESGVAHLWLVEPAQRILEAFRLQGENWMLTHIRTENDTCDVPPFEAAPFDLGVLWSR